MIELETDLKIKKVQAHYEFEKSVKKEELLDITNYSVDHSHEVRFLVIHLSIPYNYEATTLFSAYQLVQCERR